MQSKINKKIILKKSKVVMKILIKYTLIILGLSLILYYFGPIVILQLLNREIGGNTSESIEESKRRKVFKFEYKIQNDRIEVPGVDTFNVKSVWLEELWRSEYSYPEVTHRDSVDVNYKIIIHYKNSNFVGTLNETWQIKIDRDTLVDGKIQPYYFHGNYKNLYCYSYPFFYLPMDSIIIWDIKSGKATPQPDSITGSKKIGEIKMIRQ